ncbi:MAG: acetate/propionate family kinase [Steroidobacteraceae bacterium]
MDIPAVATHILTINGGSSSIRFAVYHAGESLRLELRGKLAGIGTRCASLVISRTNAAEDRSDNIEAKDHQTAAGLILNWLEAHGVLASVAAVGHRVVHGMEHIEPERVTAALLDELRHNMPFSPEHLPGEIKLIEAIQQRYPAMPQMVCFDTAFHSGMPRIAKLLPLPRRYEQQGIRRYGFHGLSYTYLMEELRRLGDPAATYGKVILAHLGNGASLAAVRDGYSIDTSMGFTPTAGLMMGSRSGDLDPGLFHYLAQTEQMSSTQLQRMVNHESGLLGVSEISADLRELLACEANDIRAAEAIALFCYQVKKWIGAFAATLGGVDTLVFAGGIGENSPIIRERICTGLEFLGINLDHARNADNAAVISNDGSATTVRVIRTDEELMIARAVSRLLATTLTEQN